ncbi:hypothetical protein WOLCODRAFT_90057 [Wolfiporia cocos MD-104 SS10]|uniref:RING-type domain-containing protein n=1 Tax=Wolfiporia cocos (strain MD-104) TaxID=742152 RepID=A0A2H3JN59_WOLCO|nr:hypothetical protein WOLCODRAFT_90057 [Wolfiporia cocos MD-104 SS10]
MTNRQSPVITARSQALPYHISLSPLLTLPPVGDDLVRAAYDLRHAFLSDPLMAYLTLRSVKRAALSARMRLEVFDQNIAQTEFVVLPFRLLVEIDVSLVTPDISRPISPPYVDKGNVSVVEEAQRRALAHAFPARTPPPKSFNGNIDVPFLYSVVGPAPRLDPPELDKALQPQELGATLLPFQRRSVAWLLNREGKSIAGDGVVHVTEQNSSNGSLPLFWEEVQDDDGETWYVSRIQGIISRRRPRAEEQVQGGILAEEPGLGKTLECISLVMLNPSVGREPSNQRWDPEAKVSVKEIKTTLIVTPSSLAQQWADELKLHAPSLKVLMYEGWDKVPVPIDGLDLEEKRKTLQIQRGHKKGRQVKASKRVSSSPTESDGSEHEEPASTRQKRNAKQPSTSAAQIPAAETDEDDLVDWCTYVNKFDVCITTYSVLQSDLGVARPPPTRPRRTGVLYSNVERPRSPLIMCEWYRVIMDEVQMVGGGMAAEMVSLIPRLSSLAVSGTPARSQVSDLIHIFRFLRVSAVTQYPRVWSRIIQPAYMDELVGLLQRYTVRTMKSSVKDELTIPQQTRYLVPIELGRVERHVYDQNFDNAIMQLGLDARGVAMRSNWEVDTGLLRTCLRKLRGLCTHPQVGQLSNAGKLHKPGVLKTMGEVLEDMRDQNWRNVMEYRRSKVQLGSTIAQLLQQNDSEPSRYRIALDVLLAAEKEAVSLIDDIQAAIVEHDKEGVALRKLTQTSKARLDPQVNADRDRKGKGKAVEGTKDSDADPDEEDAPRTPAEEAHVAKKSALQHRLRESRITLHKVLFLLGDVHHVLGESHADAENDAYSRAEELRRELLKGTEEAAARAMSHLSKDAFVKALKEEDLLIESPFLEQGGLRSDQYMKETNGLVDNLLNPQSKLLWEWRGHLIALLTQPLASRDEDASGQEYARNLETQGEAEAYLQAYAVLLADRREALVAERTLLATHDIREKRKRHTKAAQKAKVALLNAEQPEILERLNEDIQLPEHDVLQENLADVRKAIQENYGSSRALKSIMVDLSGVAARITHEHDPEKVLVRNAVGRMRALLAAQGKLMDTLQSDLAHLRKVFNERILYFRQLQEISDTVAEPTWEGNLVDAILAARLEERDIDTDIKTGRARQRYLNNLAETGEQGADDDDERCCVLCKCDFTLGYITQCAHIFCEPCLKAWMARPVGKMCPVCRTPISSDELQRFTIRQQPGETPRAPAPIVNNEAVPRSRRVIEYNVIDPHKFEDIQTMECLGSYGTKIETLVRHLLYIQLTEPGSKSIVFSAWEDSVRIIEHALARNGIKYLRINQKMGKRNAADVFQRDPEILVLLLHGERENAGLNVTCASRVFLVESVVHHAFELQAIARIDRMGQKNATEVYCYYAEETVEKNILDLAARRGQSLYTKDNAAGTVDFAAFTLDAGKKTIDTPTKKAAKGDFVFKKEDMLAIFFPHLFEDIKYLVDEDNDSRGQTAPRSKIMRVDRQHTNAVGGPSRLG